MEVPWAPGGGTRLAGVIGHPVTHSLSPTIHNAAFRSRGLDWVYAAFDVGPGQAGGAVEAMRCLGLGGLNVTMPHKAAVAEAVDDLSAVAATLGVVNTVVRRGGRLVGESTDGDGLLATLAHDHGFEPAGKRCLVLGAGGAARAAVLALAQAGAQDVAVVARRRDQADAAAALAGPPARVAPVAEVANADLVVNATPVSDELPLGLDGDDFGSGQIVVDLVYHPRQTSVMEAASTRGATSANGLGVLVHQAARSFQLWTGVDMPLEAVRSALAAVDGNQR